MTSMKKIFALVSALFIAIFATGITAFADCGPKDSTTVYINGIEDNREYYIALLSKWGANYSDEYISKQSPEWQVFYEFSLNDEYNLFDNYGLNSIDKLTGSGSNRWGYHPPESFKIILYFPDDGSFVVSEKLEKYAFDSYFTAEVAGGSMEVTRNGGMKGLSVEAGGLLVRIAVTVLIEVGIGMLFGYRARREIKLILIMNIITQIILNVLIAAGDISLGALGAAVAYFAAEILVFIIEAVVYAAELPRLTARRVNFDISAEGGKTHGIRYDNEPARKTKAGMAVSYAFVANLASFLVGGTMLIMIEVFFEAVVAG